MLTRTEGIVLKTFPFGEADLIVTYLTGTCGIVKAFAKSPRKTKSRFGSSLEPFTHARIGFWGKEDAQLPRLVQSDIIYPFQAVRESLQTFLKVSELVELTVNLLPERDANEKLFALLRDTLHAMEHGNGAAVLPVYYKIRFLKGTGYFPALGSCGRCGAVSSEFYLAQGTVLCEGCSKGQGHYLRVSPGVLSLYNSLAGWSLPKLERIRPQEGLLSELAGLIDEHIRYITEKELRTKSFRVP